MYQINEDRRRRVLLLSKHLEDIATARSQHLFQLENLEFQASVAQVEHNMLCNLDAPTSNIPDEIISLIFEAGMSLSPPNYAQASFGIIVSHVSKRWRSIAVATSRLWTHIECLCPRPFHDDDENRFKLPAHRLERLSIYLSRSRSVPVNIHIHGILSRSIPVEWSFLEDELADGFISLISKHIGHCRELVINGIPAGFLPILLNNFSHQPAPLLSSFILITPSDTDPVEFQWPLAAPRLETVNIDGTFRGQHLRTILPLFGPITSLRLQTLDISTYDGYAALRDSLMSLKRLNRLELQFSRFGQPPSTLPITLPSLKVLEVDFGGKSSYTNHIIRSIHAVSLTSLSLSGWNYDEDEEEEYWPTSQDSLAPSLRHLFLSGHFTKGFSEFDWFSRTFPNIDQLTCWGENVDVILAAVAVGGDDGYEGRPGDGLRWPKLQSIGVTDFFFHKPCDGAALRDTILKLQNGRPFRTLALTRRCLSHLDANAMAELREIINVGDFYDDWPMPFNILRRSRYVSNACMQMWLMTETQNNLRPTRIASSGAS